MLWRLGYIAGKTLMGMEVDQVIAITDYLTAQPEIDASKIGGVGLRLRRYDRPLRGGDR